MLLKYRINLSKKGRILWCLYMENKKQRIHWIDCLKGICIIFVIILHFSWNDKQMLLLGFPFLFLTAVPIFLIISV